MKQIARRPFWRVAFVLFALVLVSGCAQSQLQPDDPCANPPVTAIDIMALGTLRGTPPEIQACEETRRASLRNQLLADYQKCVSLHVDDPTPCSSITQGLHAYSVNIGQNQK